MKRFLVNNILLLVILASILATTILFVGIRHGSGNRSLLTMRSGLIKMRRGLHEFSWGLSQFVLKGLQAYTLESESLREQELNALREEHNTEICAINQQIQKEVEKEQA